MDQALLSPAAPLADRCKVSAAEKAAILAFRFPVRQQEQAGDGHGAHPTARRRKAAHARHAADGPARLPSA